MSDSVVPLNSSITAAIAATKTKKNKSIRKRKFTQEELTKSTNFTRPVIESEYEGPFWFEKSTTTYFEGEKYHHGISRRERQLLKEIVKSNFFTGERLKCIVVPLNDENSNTPRLRAFDWAVTNFSKGRPQLQVIGGSIVDPNLDYQNELKKHHRLLFDPFRRGTHLFFEVKHEAVAETHRTTVGQLCFIKWCIEHQVDKYVEAHLEEIRTHMSITTKKHGSTKRRKELTLAPKKHLRGAVFDTIPVT